MGPAVVTGSAVVTDPAAVIGTAIRRGSADPTRRATSSWPNRVASLAGSSAPTTGTATATETGAHHA